MLWASLLRLETISFFHAGAPFLDPTENTFPGQHPFTRALTMYLVRNVSLFVLAKRVSAWALVKCPQNGYSLQIHPAKTSCQCLKILNAPLMPLCLVFRFATIACISCYFSWSRLGL